jgi:hypothetical protein
MCCACGLSFGIKGTEFLILQTELLYAHMCVTWQYCSIDIPRDDELYILVRCQMTNAEKQLV